MSVASAVIGFFAWKPVRYTLLGLLGLIVLAVASIYGVSEWRLHRAYTVPKIALRVAAPADTARGDHLAAIVGCKDCHGPHGRVMFEAPGVGRIIAPDLALQAKEYTVDELATLFRTGVKRNGESALIMPGNSFSSLSDADVADVAAWFHNLKPGAETETRTTSVGPIGRVMAVMGALPQSVDDKHEANPPAVTPTEPLAHGEYMVKTACGHCHRLDEEHVVKPGTIAPPVRPMAQSYTLDEFKTLLRTGKAVGDREVGLMSLVSRSAFSNLSDAEIKDIHAYLNAGQPAQTASKPPTPTP